VISLAAVVALSTSVVQISMACLFSVSTEQANITISGILTFDKVMHLPVWVSNGSYFLINDAANFVRANLTDATP